MAFHDSLPPDGRASLKNVAGGHVDGIGKKAEEDARYQPFGKPAAYPVPVQAKD